MGYLEEKKRLRAVKEAITKEPELVRVERGS